MDWIELGSRFGIPFLMIVAAAYFWTRYVWPFIMQQVKDSKEAITASTKEMAEQRKEFLEALEKQMESVSDEMRHRDEILTTALRERDMALEKHTQMFSEALVRRDAQLSRVSGTLELMSGVLESLVRDK